MIIIVLLFVEYFETLAAMLFSIKDLKLNLTFQQGPVLSPLRDSPLQSKDETRSGKSVKDSYFDAPFF